MSRAPAFLAAVAFASGIGLGATAWRPPVWWLVALLVCAGAAMIPARLAHPRLGYALALLSLAALGALDIGTRDHSRPAQLDLEPFLKGDVLITGHVLADSTSRPRGETVDIQTECIAILPQPAKTATQAQIANPDVQPLTLSDEGPSVYAFMRPVAKRRRAPKVKPAPATAQTSLCAAITAGLRVTVYPHEVGEDEDAIAGHVRKFQYGERLRFTARLRPPRNFGNPGAWDYVAYLREHGIVATGSARADRVEALSGFGGTRIGRWRRGARRSILAKIDELWPGPRGGLIGAMVIGDKSELSRDVRTAFQRTGIYHILVVSGMNVGIIAAVVFWLLRRMRVSELTSSALTVALSCGYALLTDGGAPILRATLMLAIYLGARLLYRERAPLNAVGLAAFVLIAIEPQALFDASFQLTFVSVLAITGIAVPLLERTSLPYRRATFQLDALAYDLTLPPRQAQFRLDLRLLIEKSGRLIDRRVARIILLNGIRFALGTFDLVMISAVAQFALALPMAIYFHRAVLVGLPANLVVVPLTGILMPAGAAAVALSYISPLLARPAAWIAGWSLDAITSTIRVVGGWRAAEWRTAALDPWVAYGCVAAIAVCLLASQRRRWMAASALALLAISAVCVAFVPPRRQTKPGVLEFTAIDVGQADSTLVITPDGRALLVDAAGSMGPMQSEFDFGEDVISPYLWSRGITRLDAVAITHAHSDHIGGMRSVMTNFRPRELWMGPNAPNRALEELLQQAQRMKVKVATRVAPEEFSIGGAHFRVLAPPPGWITADEVRNNKKMERTMLAAGPRAMLLHVAHNGSATSTSPEFLDAVRPRYAVISVGARNSFRHPRYEVLERLAARQVSTYRTDLSGAASFYLDGEKITVARRTR